MLTALVTGADGQLGQALVSNRPEGIDLVATNRASLDITDVEAVNSAIQRVSPDIVINAAAYTAVDKAESDSELAYAINELGPKHLSAACPETSYFLQVSTDFVFDGTKNTPYSPQDAVNPLSVYGASKLAGERAVFSSKPNNSGVLRTSWVYGVNGANFLKSMLRLMAERGSLGIVVDQVGTPTSVSGLADVCWKMALGRVSGTYHWSDAGVASWYDFAEAIMNEAVERKILNGPIQLNAIPSSAYPTPAQRPSYSVLDKSALLEAMPGLQNTHWHKQLKSVLAQLEQQRV